ncbi:MAG: hypothetical protein AAFQ28_14545 [Pseudomonadota bacterium]
MQQLETVLRDGMNDPDAGWNSGLSVRSQSFTMSQVILPRPRRWR